MSDEYMKGIEKRWPGTDNITGDFVKVTNFHGNAVDVKVSAIERLETIDGSLYTWPANCFIKFYDGGGLRVSETRDQVLSLIERAGLVSTSGGMSNRGLSKLVEECGELCAIAGKKMAYMDTDDHPDGAGSMRRRMEEEIADVKAASTFVVQKFELDGDAINRRAAAKLKMYHEWDGS